MTESRALRVLHLEDEPHDRELVAAVMRAGGLDCEIVAVDTREAFEAALHERFDVILSDDHLPTFDGEAAQAIAARRAPDVPFICVSGTMGEDIAVERVKDGATDYVLKQNLSRLPAAVVRGIKEVEQKARIEADRANRAKSEFLSRMSHDLRTPLNAILGFAQLLATERLSDEENECVQQILLGGRHLLELINEVLDISRIEAGRLSLSPEPVAVREIVSQAVNLIAPLARQRQVSLVVEDAPDAVDSVVADRQRLSQVLLNLLSNAVKYNRTGGTATVSFARISPSRFRIRVSDTGAGISPQKLQLLFTPFERLGAEGSAIEGTGLGLALSRGLAEAMGGTIGVVSEVDRGSTFWIELSRTEERDMLIGAEPATPIARSTPRPATVLYIEDNTSNVRLMERVLGRRPGITLLHAGLGQEGVALAAEERPDVIFLDMHLPDMLGDEVLHQLWSDPELRRIPVAVLSADAMPGQVRRVMASGAAAYLTKPLDLKQVLETLDQMLLESGGVQTSVGPDHG